ncbi:hypothetical protein BDN72DRAFT_744755, partial [Pluteus cervinus]
LMTELSCLGWASALMKMVDQYVAEKMSQQGPLPSDTTLVPLRMTRAGIAVPVTADRGEHAWRVPSAYLIEEWIPGEFLKYIHNSTAALHFLTGFGNDNLLRERQLYLSFVQHAQYVLTDSLVFVSDFQGT